jgi:hypothetical protein
LASPGPTLATGGGVRSRQKTPPKCSLRPQEPSEGLPRPRRRGFERGNVAHAEAAARQLGQLSLEHALKLVFLYAEREPIKFERAALRWLGRYVTEGKAVSLLKAQLAATALSELRAGEREAAAKLLQGLVQRL